MSTSGDIMSTSGDILITSEITQYMKGNHNLRWGGGYHEYIGGVLSTLEGYHDSCRGIS